MKVTVATIVALLGLAGSVAAENLPHISCRGCIINPPSKHDPTDRGPMPQALKNACIAYYSDGHCGKMRNNILPPWMNPEEYGGDDSGGDDSGDAVELERRNEGWDLEKRMPISCEICRNPNRHGRFRFYDGPMKQYELDACQAYLETPGQCPPAKNQYQGITSFERHTKLHDGGPGHVAARTVESQIISVPTGTSGTVTPTVDPFHPRAMVTASPDLAARAAVTSTALAGY